MSPLFVRVKGNFFHKKLCFGATRRGSKLAKKDYESRTEALIQPMIDEHHFELVDVEWVKEFACIY